ncbi:hypothetical protein EG329_013697 [Mollisiaceae sp. DMI_Dod_QoI]|nr:hypothetical protein EG329_013697 [Helotiales sp. DMI_Dod_QoI]
MSSQPKLPCLLHGRGNVPARHPTFRSSPSASSNTTTLDNDITPQSSTDKDELQKRRIATWLASPTNSQPQYHHTTSSASMIAHTKDIIAYLKEFDKAMSKNEK